MTFVKAGDTVRIHYTGRLRDGTVFDSSLEREPLEFTVGSGEVIAGLDHAVAGMAPGERRLIEIACAMAYGPRDPSRLSRIARTRVPREIPLDIGMPLVMRTADGQDVNVTVAEVTDSDVVLDANHPLAGKDLTFSVELVAIV